MHPSQQCDGSVVGAGSAQAERLLRRTTRQLRTLSFQLGHRRLEGVQSCLLAAQGNMCAPKAELRLPMFRGLSRCKYCIGRRTALDRIFRMILSQIEPGELTSSPAAIEASPVLVAISSASFRCFRASSGSSCASRSAASPFNAAPKPGSSCNLR
jgi:hypothetical protein